MHHAEDMLMHSGAKFLLLVSLSPFWGGLHASRLMSFKGANFEAIAPTRIGRVGKRVGRSLSKTAMCVKLIKESLK